MIARRIPYERAVRRIRLPIRLGLFVLAAPVASVREVCYTVSVPDAPDDVFRVSFPSFPGEVLSASLAWNLRYVGSISADFCATNGDCLPSILDRKIDGVNSLASYGTVAQGDPYDYGISNDTDDTQFRTFDLSWSGLVDIDPEPLIGLPASDGFWLRATLRGYPWDPDTLEITGSLTLCAMVRE